MAEATSNPEMIQRTRALSAFSSAKEYASVQRAVIAAALPEQPKTFESSPRTTSSTRSPLSRARLRR